MVELLIVSLVPQLVPGRGGVGDFSRVLNGALLAVGGPACRIAEVAAGWKGPGKIHGLRRAAALRQRVASTVATHSFERLALLLHYSGYGYSKRGAPLWLLPALSGLRRESGATLITYFHELYAEGPPMSSAFWLSTIQQRVAAGIAQISDGVLTNCTNYAEWLAARSGNPLDQIPATGMLSTVGEPEHVPRFDERAPRAVVFGSRGTRGLVYDRDWHSTASALVREGISEVHDIGDTITPPRSVAGVKFVQHGHLRGEDVSRLMISSRLGLLSYPRTHLDKSTVLAAYRAHGVVPLIEDSTAAASVPLPEYCIDLKEFCCGPGMINGRELSQKAFGSYRASTWSHLIAGEIAGLLDSSRNG